MEHDSLDDEVVEYENDADLPFVNSRNESAVGSHPDVDYAIRVRPEDPEKKVVVKKTIRIKHEDTMPLETSKVTCQREAKIMRAARHAHTIEVIATYFYKPPTEPNILNFYIVMANAERGDLSKFLGSDSLNFKLNERWIGCLIRVVAYIHRLGIRHRDIKPPNILVNAKNEVLLADFGISKMSLGKTVPTTMPGWNKPRTPSYCAPEVDEAPGRTRGRSADIFSLGAVILEMLLSLFHSADYKELVHIVGTGANRSYARNINKVHDFLDKRIATRGQHAEMFELCRKMLDNNRDQRPQADTIESQWLSGSLMSVNDQLQCSTCDQSIPVTKEHNLVEACRNDWLGEVERLLISGAKASATGAIHQAARCTTQPNMGMKE
ncbi:kinase-like protein [Canariomyces notabilis]|uniref:Kinase-like protein n=1 Tax=Canariomyces notabilis TaxID=2074819 RepID=A0AAN6QR70_9PEZI|nr:kinase-like protein [Canariomyces arenarius]